MHVLAEPVMPAADREELELQVLRAARPRTRAQCQDGPRPCPWASCRHHLAHDLVGRGLVDDIEDLRETCSLDVADDGPQIYDSVRKHLGISRERVRQIEEKALDRLVDELDERWVDRDEVLELLAARLDVVPVFSLSISHAGHGGHREG